MDLQRIRERFRADYESADWPVVLTAIPFALVTGIGAVRIFEDAAVAFLIALMIGVFVPHAYDEFWPHDHASIWEVVWTAAASVAVTLIFLVAYLFAGVILENTDLHAPLAFLVTIVVGFGILVRAGKAPALN